MYVYVLFVSCNSLTLLIILPAAGQITRSVQWKTEFQVLNSRSWCFHRSIGVSMAYREEKTKKEIKNQFSVLTLLDKKVHVLTVSLYF